MIHKRAYFQKSPNDTLTLFFSFIRKDYFYIKIIKIIALWGNDIMNKWVVLKSKVVS